MKPRTVPRSLLATLLAGSAFFCFSYLDNARESVTSHAQAQDSRCDIPFPLPNPSDIGSQKFEKLLYSFLEKGCYRGWVADARIRDSGPFIGGASFGTHDSVKIFYSPAIWEWLKRKNRAGEIPDGAVIIKEMFAAPA